MHSTCNSTLSEAHWTTDNIVGNFTLHTLGSIICGGCAVIATIISLFLVVRHARHYTVPNEQRHIIRILLMVPIYAITSWLSYVWYWHAVYWEVARDCYEAFAIAGFFALLCNYISPSLRGQKKFFSALEDTSWVWPLKRVRGPRSGLTWFNIIWVGIFQYIFIRIGCTVAAAATQALGLYCEGSMSPKFAHMWTTLANVIAVTVAMYCLITFYLGLKTQPELERHSPFFKLLCIKLVIFFSFWQMTMLDTLSSFGAIKPSKKVSYGDISVGFNSLLICAEMIIFAILHLFAYSWKEYDRGPHKTTSVFVALFDAFNPWDIIRASVRGVRWLCCGINRRPKAPEKYEEESALVGNASDPADTESPQPEYDDGMSVHHPAPSDKAQEASTLKAQISLGSHHQESVEMTNTPTRPRQRPHAPPSSYSQQVANSGYGHAIAAPPQGPHEPYRDQSPNPVGRQGHLAYPSANYMPSTPRQGGAPSEHLHSLTSPVAAGAHSPMLPNVGGQTSGPQQQQQQQQQQGYSARKPT